MAEPRIKTRKEVGADMYRDENGDLVMARQTRCPNAYDDPDLVAEFSETLKELIEDRYPRAKVEDGARSFYVTISKHVVFHVQIEGLAG